jgi:predicted ATP-grasp superfamily ATP-dependent carboligase
VGVAIVRSLGRKRIEITAADNVRAATAFFSRYCRHRVAYAPPERNSSAFIASMLGLVKRRHYDVLIPYSDLVMMPISRHRDMFTRFVKVPIPEYETIARAHNKSEMLDIAAEQGISCPRTYRISAIHELKRISQNIEYPVVIKPRASTIWHGNTGSTTNISRENYANSAEELVPKYERVHRRSEWPLVQEYIPGEGYGVCALLNESDPRAVFVHKRIREYPITGGPSTLRVSVLNPQLRNLGLKILKALKWHGVAMVEFKMDSRDNKPKLMEINGRFWGSLALSMWSGVDFPYLLYKMAAEGDVDPVFNYKVGVKCRWIVGDFLHFASALRGSANRWKETVEFAKFYESNLHYDELCMDDPFPVVGAMIVGIQDLYHLMRRRRSILGEYLEETRQRPTQVGASWCLSK